MKIVFRIKEAAKERAITLTSIAGKLHIKRSNMSAIASGKRGVSLYILKKISDILGCAIDELIIQEKPAPVFKNKKTEAVLRKIEEQNFDGMDKSWLHNLALAQAAHYKAARKA